MIYSPTTSKYEYSLIRGAFFNAFQSIWQAGFFINERVLRREFLWRPEHVCSDAMALTFDNELRIEWTYNDAQQIFQLKV